MEMSAGNHKSINITHSKILFPSCNLLFSHFILIIFVFYYEKNTSLENLRNFMFDEILQQIKIIFLYV
jgi:hypothetical protein